MAFRLVFAPLYRLSLFVYTDAFFTNISFYVLLTYLWQKRQYTEVGSTIMTVFNSVRFVQKCDSLKYGCFFG